MAWEFKDEQEMYAQLVGNFYGSNPELIQNQIAKSRKEIAISIATHLNINSSHRVLEVGSGAGHMASVLAPLVKNYTCADVSSSFLYEAKKNCAGIPNIDFQKIDSSNLDFLENDSINVILSHAVFIHLNIYDFYLYFSSFSRVLKKGGRVYLDFLSADNVEFRKNSFFQEHVKYFEADRNSMSTLLNFHGARAIVSMAKEFDLHVVFKYFSSNNCVALVLEKGPQRFSFFNRSTYLIRLFWTRLKWKNSELVNRK